MSSTISGSYCRAGPRTVLARVLRRWVRLNARLASSVPLRSVTMYSMLGGKMSRTMVSGTSVQLARPSAGVYFVEAQATSGDIVRVRWTVAR